MFQLPADIAHLSKTGADVGVIHEIMTFPLKTMKNSESVIKTHQNEWHRHSNPWKWMKLPWKPIKIHEIVPETHCFFMNLPLKPIKTLEKSWKLCKTHGKTPIFRTFTCSSFQTFATCSLRRSHSPPGGAQRSGPSGRGRCHVSWIAVIVEISWLMMVVNDG